MTDFLAVAPTLDANWRSIILFGRNVASYKFALAQALLDLTNRSDESVRLEELAVPYAQHLTEHLARVDKQATSQSSKFLDACRAFNRSDKSNAARDKLIGATVRLGFNNVIDAFHVVGAGPVPVRFFVDERNAGSTPGIRLTDDLRRLASSLQGGALTVETEARWRLVETAWSLDMPRAGIAVQADAKQNLLFIQRARRIGLTSVRAALNGYQRGRCFYCSAEVPLAATEVDHFFPWVLKERGIMLGADGVWNLVLACRDCNRGERGKHAGVPAPTLVARLHERNNWLVESHHPLRETIMLQTGADAEGRAFFLRSQQQIALEALVHQWEPGRGML